ncbi:MAG: DUF4231 domain-containing protein [Flavobacteriaceae bacterium]
MTESQYMKDRVDNQISWYGKKSAINKKLYLRLNGVIIFFAASIPALSGFSSSEFYGEKLRWVIAGLGIVTASLTGIVSLWKFQEKWATYRMTAEALEREKILYNTGAGHYAGRRADYKFFVQNIERIMNNENASWNDLINEKPGNDDSG